MSAELNYNDPAATVDANKPTIRASHRSQQSLLFPSLLERFSSTNRMEILEIGSAFPETVAFFSQFKCRLHFTTMYSDPVLQLQSGEMTESELVDHFTRSFNFPAGTRFDLCLYWDFLNYLNDKALRAFNTAIKPYIHKSTKAHAFTVRTLDTPIANQYYGIEKADRFTIRPRVIQQMACFPHTQVTLVNLLTCFDIDQGMLLPDGRLEVLMTAVHGSVAPRPWPGMKKKYKSRRHLFNSG